MICSTGWGRIVNVSSMMGLVSSPGRVPYSTTKSGVIGMTRVRFIRYLSNIEFHLPAFRSTSFPAQWLVSSITIVGTSISGERGMDPFAMTVNNLREEIGRASNLLF